MRRLLEACMLLRPRDGEEDGSKVLYGVELVLKRVGDNWVIYGRAKDVEDLTRLKRIVEEVISRVLRGYEGKRAGSTPTKYR